MEIKSHTLRTEINDERIKQLELAMATERQDKVLNEGLGYEVSLNRGMRFNKIDQMTN